MDADLLTCGFYAVSGALGLGAVRVSYNVYRLARDRFFDEEWNDADQALLEKLDNPEPVEVTEPRGLTVIPPVGLILSREFDKPLYDREWLPDDTVYSNTYFFVNTRSFTHLASRQKQQISDTNLIGNGGSMPRGHRIEISGLSLIPDAAAYQGSLELIKDEATVRMYLGSCPYAEWPAWQVLSDERMSNCDTRCCSDCDEELLSLVGPNGDTFEWECPMCGTPENTYIREGINAAARKSLEKSRGVLRLETPVMLEETECFSFHLIIPKKLPSGLYMRMVLHGKQWSPICG